MAQEQQLSTILDDGTSVDISPKTDTSTVYDSSGHSLDTLMAAKQNRLTPGNGVNIEGNVISVNPENLTVVVDNLTSDKSNASLSANQGRILDGKISKVSETLGSISQDIADLMGSTYPLTVSWASSNAGTREVGNAIIPTGTLKIERKGQDVSASATVVITPSATLSADKKTFTGASISSGSVSYTAKVTQGGQSVTTSALNYSFTYYRYRGALSAVPTDYPTAIKGLATKELSTTPTLGTTDLGAGKYYLFAVKGNVTLKCQHASTGGEISGCITGTCNITSDKAGTNLYSYILVPASASAWQFKIVN